MSNTTDIDVDDALLGTVMRRFQIPTKKAAVEFALRRVAGEPMSRQEVQAMRGTGWDGELSALRDNGVSGL